MMLERIRGDKDPCSEEYIFTETVSMKTHWIFLYKILGILLLISVAIPVIISALENRVPNLSESWQSLHFIISVLFILSFLYYHLFFSNMPWYISITGTLFFAAILWLFSYLGYYIIAGIIYLLKLLIIAISRKIKFSMLTWVSVFEIKSVVAKGGLVVIYFRKREEISIIRRDKKRIIWCTSGVFEDTYLRTEVSGETTEYDYELKPLDEK